MACRMTRLAASAVDTTARAGTSDYRHWAEPVAVARSDPTQTPTPTTNWLAFLSSSGIYPKLSVSSPGDADEREADVVAERVMRMAAPAAAPLSAGRAGPAWPAPVRPVRRTTRMPGLPVYGPHIPPSNPRRIAVAGLGAQADRGVGRAVAVVAAAFDHFEEHPLGPPRSSRLPGAYEHRRARPVRRRSPEACLSWYDKLVEIAEYPRHLGALGR